MFPEQKGRLCQVLISFSLTWNMATSACWVCSASLPAQGRVQAGLDHPKQGTHRKDPALQVLTMAGEWSAMGFVLFQCSQQNKRISTQCLEPFGSRLKVFISSS